MTGTEPEDETSPGVLTPGEPDYRAHTIDSLRDILRHIDPDRFPERAVRLREEIALRIANPGLYEPPRPDALAWWRAHWPLVLGILGILVGLAGAAAQGAGMMSVFAGAAEPGPIAAGTGGERSPAGSDASRREGPRGGGQGSGAAAMAPVFWVVAMAPPGALDPPAWFRAFLAGARFAGMAIGALLIVGGILLLLRRGEGTFYWSTAFALGCTLTIAEQAATAAALTVPPGPLILGVVLNVALTAACLAPVLLSGRAALKS